MKHILSFSGGKDSLSSWLMIHEDVKKEDLLVVFCDIEWEHPYTYAYIEEIIKHFGAESNFRILRNKQSLGFESLMRLKKRFPSVTARFCTTSLKVEPMIDFILDEVQEHSIVYQGIRHEESDSRAKMSQICTYFKYYFEPYDRNDWKLERLLKSEKPTILQRAKIKKLKDKVEKGQLEPKFYTYRKKEIFEYCQTFNTDVVRPVIHMTSDEVVRLILDAGLKMNPLYYLGSGRVGCYPCIFITHSELWQIIINDYWVIENIAKMEIDCGTTFFAPDYIPERYHTGATTNKHGKTVTFCWITDVVKYLKDKHATGDMFEDLEKQDRAERGCMSAFNICER